MEKQVQLPELAESVVEAEVVEWRVGEGERVAADQPLLEVASDKVTVDLPSPYTGTVVARLVQPGDTVAVGAAVARIAVDDDSTRDGDDGAAPTAEASAPAAAQTASQSPSTAAGGESDESRPAPAGAEATEDAGDSLSLFKPSSAAEAPVANPFLDRPAPTGSEPAPAVAAAERPPAVPSARRAARRLGIDIASVAGSGPAGRIRVADVERHAESASEQSDAARDDRGALTALAYRTPPGYEDRERRAALRGTRRAIARHMTAAHLHAVRTLVVEEADMTRLMDLRAALAERAGARGVRLGYLAFVFKALVGALKAYPEVNSSLDESADEIVYKDYYNMGLAVAAEAGLTVPVVRDVDTRALIEVAGEINRLADDVRAGTIGADELRGASFSVTNIGSIGGLMSFPIINLPDAAILGVHAIRKRPVAVDDAVAIRPMMYLSLSFDHRLIDGARATEFLLAVIRVLEQPEALLLDAV